MSSFKKMVLDHSIKFCVKEKTIIIEHFYENYVKHYADLFKNLFMKVKTIFQKSKVYYVDLSTTFFKIKIDIFLH